MPTARHGVAIVKKYERHDSWVTKASAAGPVAMKSARSGVPISRPSAPMTAHAATPTRTVAPAASAPAAALTTLVRRGEVDVQRGEHQRLEHDLEERDGRVREGEPADVGDRERVQDREEDDVVLDAGGGLVDEDSDRAARPADA